MSNNERYLYDLPPDDQATLKSSLTRLYDDLHRQTEGFGHEARQYLVTINLAGIAGALTYIAALDKAQKISLAWGSLAFFSLGVFAIGCVMAINALSFREFRSSSVRAYEAMLKGAHDGITIADFWGTYRSALKKQERWAMLADTAAYTSWGFSITGLIAIAYSIYRNTTS